ncbi:MAG: nascent polypeptide-associated complex protein [Candidatus Diapherotrites archaeon]|nr:nascent polypeptide-associated complex protein [Candidatus Diapherotrites archaeon]MDZ4256445.1 nascent polypeptide-associated complex protein [archaeon]
MFPGLGGVNPSQMKAMMRQMGITSEDLSAARVTIELDNGTKLVFDQPSVNCMEMKGQKTYTISGDAHTEEGGSTSAPPIPEDDIALVAQQANVSQEQAKDALEAHDGDMAAAIASLKKDE